MSETNTELDCKQCGNQFVLTQNEVEWYEQKGFNLPKRCPACRAENRMSKEEKR